MPLLAKCLTAVAAASLGLLAATAASEAAEVPAKPVAPVVGGDRPNGSSYIDAQPSSGDGRFVVFRSNATNLVEGKATDRVDVFLRDRLEGTTTWLQAGAGGEPDHGSSWAVMGQSAKYLLFKDLTTFTGGFIIPGRVFLYDVDGGSTAPLGATGIEFVTSGDSRWVAVAGLSVAQPGYEALYLLDRMSGARTTIATVPYVIPPGSIPLSQSISTDGRFVAFVSDADGLVEGDDDGQADVFLFDRKEGTLSLVPTEGVPSSAYRQWLQLSGNGRFIAYSSDQGVYVYDRSTRTSQLMSVGNDGQPLVLPYDKRIGSPAISADGRFVTFVFGGVVKIRDRVRGYLYPSTITADGRAGGVENVRISGDGRTILLEALRNGGTQVYLSDDWREEDADTAILAAVAPSSRSVQVGSPATAFATILNTGDYPAIECAIAAPDDIAADFSFQTTDPVTNDVTGEPGQPVDIPAGAAQTFLVTLVPQSAIEPRQVAFTFDCANSDPAPSNVGVNTLLLSSEFTPVPDPVPVYATLKGDGTVDLSEDPAHPAFFTVAAVNIGIDALMDVVPVVGETPVDALVCETNPANGLCYANPWTSWTSYLQAGVPHTYTVFLYGQGQPIPVDYVNGRVALEFRDEGGTVRGSTSVVVLPLPAEETIAAR